MAISLYTRSTSQLGFSWSSHGSSVKYYNIEVYYGSSTSGSVVGSAYNLSSSTMSRAFSGLSAGATYTAKVYSRNSSNTTIKVETYTCGTTPNSIPYALSVYNLAWNGFTVSWSSPSGTVGYYGVTLRYGSSSGSLVTSTTTYGTSYNFSGLYGGNNYYVEIKPYNSWGDASGGSRSQTVGTPTPLPAPSAPSYLYASPSANSAYVYWGSASNADTYNIEIYRGSSASGTRVDYSYGFYSTSYTTYSVSPNTTYTAKVYANNSTGNGTPSTVTFTTTVGQPSSINTTLYSDSIYAYWSSVSGATGYTVEVRWGGSGGSYIMQPTNISSTGITIPNLTSETTYWISVKAYNSNGTGLATTRTATTTSAPPSTPTNFTVTGRYKNSFSFSWSTVSKATSYRVEIYHYDTGQLINSGTTSNTYMTLSGLNEYVYYQIKYYAQNSVGNSSPAYTYVTTLDGTPPAISITTANSKGSMSVNWTASDSMSGLRSSSTYAVAITRANSTTHYHKAYTTNRFYTFTSDADGYEFVDGATYGIRVIAYDNDGNEGTVYHSMEYKNAKPPTWSWHTAKSSGNQIYVTATEWNSLCKRINDFRAYKNLSAYSFTTVYTGNDISASVVNQAINAISPMRSTGLPSTVSRGTTITASFFNGIVNTLNAIP